ncbi:hypothetical protein BH23CYA1_BH23CYA1_17140 [soil metagenome]
MQRNLFRKVPEASSYPGQPDPRHLTAYFKTAVGGSLLAGGGLCTVFGLSAGVQAHQVSTLAAIGVLVSLLGWVCLRRPYFLLEPHQLTVYGLFGMPTRRYTFESWDVVKADSRHIYIDDGGITKKVPVLPWLVKTGDWLTLRELL